MKALLIDPSIAAVVAVLYHCGGMVLLFQRGATADDGGGALEGTHQNHLTAAKQYLNGKHFRFTSVESPPFVMMTKHHQSAAAAFNGSASTTAISYGGLCFEMIHILQSIYNFTYTVGEPFDGAFGILLRNGSWTGMIGQVANGDFDMGVQSFSFTHNRNKVVDYTVAMYEESLTILIPPPIPESRLFTCVRPFQWQVWAVLLCVLVVLPIIIWLPINLSTQKKMPTEQIPKFKDVYAFVYGVLLTQSALGSRLTRYHPTTTILTSFWCLVVVVFIYAYIGTFISFLSVPRLKSIISSLDDLPNSGLSWGVPRGTSMESLFMEAEEGIYKVIGDGLRKHPEHLTLDSEDTAVRKVINESCAHINEKSYNGFIIDQDYRRKGNCRMTMAKTEFYKVYQGFILPKQSALKPIIDLKLQQMIESGLIEYWRKRLWYSTKQCDPANHKYGPRRLVLDSFQSPFLIWGIGAALALAAFVVENLVFIYLF